MVRQAHQPGMFARKHLDGIGGLMNINGKMFNPGELRTQIKIQKRVVTTDSAGFQDSTWTDIATVWSKWENAHGANALASGAIWAENPATVTLRYRADIKTTSAILMNGERYEIISIDDIRNRHEIMELKVSRIRKG